MSSWERLSHLAANLSVPQVKLSMNPDRGRLLALSCPLRMSPAPSCFCHADFSALCA
jgi:hypothetical protein